MYLQGTSHCQKRGRAQQCLSYKLSLFFQRDSLLTCGIPYLPPLSQQVTLNSLSHSRSHQALLLPQQRPVPVWIREVSQVKTEILWMGCVCVCLFGSASRASRAPQNNQPHSCSSAHASKREAAGLPLSGTAQFQVTLSWLQNHTHIYREMEPTQSHRV